MDFFYYSFKKFCAERGEIENYGQGKQDKRNFNTPEGKGNSDQGKNNGSKCADGTATDFVMAYLRILNMFGIQDVSSHPIQGQANQNYVNAEYYDGEFVFTELTEEARGKRNQAD